MPTAAGSNTQMPPPPPPPPRTDSLPSSPQMDNTGVGIGPGPIRHPRPVSAAELHLELEKEQENMVNRLTRELSALRAQTASVASTTSSTSDHFFSNDQFGTGATIIPTSARRHRSSSNLSARSSRSIRENLTSAASTSVSGVAAPRDQTVQAGNMETLRPEMSRQNSTSAGVYRSSSIHASPRLSQVGYHRASVSSNTNYSEAASNPRSPGFSSAGAAARYEEAQLHRAELEAVRKENETLRQRVRDLERSLAATTPTRGHGLAGAAG
ncbi:uncharacterized protein HMPREF1541_05028 [Cyphellophora europaea CBS 101466]|uniref:Uncharacterized protein n=1 Tax=Cyphellophora europaea (strain CBS 101466) TaxID=1220924 RepID=W2RY78_CYPE1|nr:uncharacterized protein HMPREF1541_05028 [Cyphellophora europaea CBS 101466]ETN40748.1 hypothetical protein HMPREF1541_05028 [Cyphellophora europaea CBS 101466]